MSINNHCTHTTRAINYAPHPSRHFSYHTMMILPLVLKNLSLTSVEMESAQVHRNTSNRDCQQHNHNNLAWWWWQGNAGHDLEHDQNQEQRGEEVVRTREIIETLCRADWKFNKRGKYIVCKYIKPFASIYVLRSNKHHLRQDFQPPFPDHPLLENVDSNCGN